MTVERPNELWMEFSSVVWWNDVSLWDEYLRSAKTVLGDLLIKLDQNDPARRKADTATGEGKFIAKFGPREESRWLLGRFEQTKIWFTLQIYKNGGNSTGRRRDNNILFTTPENLHTSGCIQYLVELFCLTTERLGIFYAFADLKRMCSRAKKTSPPSYSLNSASELLGVSWLTYFGPHYCEFFGRERLDSLKQLSDGPAGGVTLRLAKTPSQVPDGLRQMMERRLGTETFAGTGGAILKKPEGRYALTLDEFSTYPPARRGI